MAKTAKLRLNLLCLRGATQDPNTGAWTDHHRQCSGYEERTVGRKFRCQCGCHKAPAPKG